jgi:hypothetical protein
MEIPVCPRCGSDRWNELLTWSSLVTFGGSEDHAVLVTHTPTGIAVEARSYRSSGHNCRAALQSVALQVLDRRQRSRTPNGV